MLVLPYQKARLTRAQEKRTPGQKPLESHQRHVSRSALEVQIICTHLHLFSSHPPATAHGELVLYRATTVLKLKQVTSGVTMLHRLGLQEFQTDYTHIVVLTAVPSSSCREKSSILCSVQ